MANIRDIKIFSLNRLKFEELWQDALSWIKKTYNEVDAYFNITSPFGQLLHVILHMGRMIFYYIEDSITGMNIRTTYRPDQIRGLATLTGHRPSRPMAARGAVRITYRPKTQDYDNQVIYIPNKTSVTNMLNGYKYIILFNSDNAKITCTAGNYVDAHIIQGTLKYQSATGDGLQLQSFSFTERNYEEIDELFVNVYVNGEHWEKVDSLLDLGYNQKGVVVKTGFLGGIDIYFGNGDMGAMPPQGSTILVEYIVTEGYTGNMLMETMNTSAYGWNFNTDGYAKGGETVNLNDCFNVTCSSNIIFGTSSENIRLTQELAPYASRSMVLANDTNFYYFFKRMNMFSVVEVIKGYNTYQDNMANIAYETAYAKYTSVNNDYINAVSLYGADSANAVDIYNKLQETISDLDKAKAMQEDAQLDDNTVYLLLIPDIRTRIGSGSNYFNCDENLFVLSDDEQQALLNYIEVSGQRVLTVENRILTPKTPRFALNVSIKIWDDYSISDVYNTAIEKLSDYFIGMNRRDIIPISDIIAIFENTPGVDSVRASFDADPANETIYGEDGNYGIDDFGDIMLCRNVVDGFGNKITIRDIYPLIRGGFTSKNGTVYSNVQSLNDMSAFNINISGYSTNRRLAIENATVIN